MWSNIDIDDIDNMSDENKLDVLWGDYLKYKNIKIYPFLMKDYGLFKELTSILLFNKNSLGYVEIIKMSYLKFLITIVPHMVDDKGNKRVDVVLKLNLFLEYIFKEQKFSFDIDEEEKIFIYVETDDGRVFLNERDFDNIKKLVLFQNAIPFLDSKLHPDLQEELQQSMEFIAKKQGHNDGDLADQVISYKCEMKLPSYESIKAMTIFQFRKELARLNLIKDYQIYKTAETSGMVKFEKPIPHWLSHISDKPDYSQLLMDKRAYDIKMSEVNG